MARKVIELACNGMKRSPQDRYGQFTIRTQHGKIAGTVMAPFTDFPGDLLRHSLQLQGINP